MQPKLGSRVGLFVALAVTFGGCNQVDREDTLAEASASDDDARSDLIAGFGGALTEQEAGCVADIVLASEDVSVGQVLDFAESPGTGGPVAELFASAMDTCYDPTAVVPRVPIEGEFREQLMNGVRTSLPDLTGDQEDCILGQLEANGIGLREVVLSGYVPEQSGAIETFQLALEGCVSP